LIEKNGLELGRSEIGRSEIERRMEELNKILDLELAMPQSADEASYCRVWQLQVQPRWPCSPIKLALLGGRLAHDFATVFTAGYQAATRAVFPQARFDGLCALAVSEDRSKELPMPDVSWRALDEQFLLDGTKTWVACFDDDVQDLLLQLSQTQYAADKIWQHDHRLISMYGAGLQKQIR